MDRALEIGEDRAELLVAPGVAADPASRRLDEVPGAVEVALAVPPDRLLAGAGGEDPGDRPVDDAVALLVVVRPRCPRTPS